MPAPTPRPDSPFVPHTVRDCFRGLPDPRVVGRVTHALDDILAIVFLTTLAGCDDFVATADYADARREWRQDRVGLACGTASPPTTSSPASWPPSTPTTSPPPSNASCTC